MITRRELLVLPLLPAVIKDPALEAFLLRLEVAQRGLQGLSAEFEQRSRVKLFAQELRSQGRLYCLKGPPLSLRWEYLQPDPSVLVVREGKAQLRMGTQPVRTFDTGKDSTMAAIFFQLSLWLGSGSLREAQGDYQLRLQPGSQQLTLVPQPHNPLSKVFGQVTLELDPKSALLRALVLRELSGDEKEIRLSKVQKNPRLPPALFVL